MNVTGGKEVELTPLSGRIPEQRLVQKYPRFDNGLTTDRTIGRG